MYVCVHNTCTCNILYTSYMYMYNVNFSLETDKCSEEKTLMGICPFRPPQVV